MICNYRATGYNACICSNIKVRCKPKVNGLICNAHMDLLFCMSVVTNRLSIRGVARNKVYLTNTRLVEEYIPFPYNFTDSGDVCLANNWEQMLQKWIAKIDLNQKEACQLLHILGTLFSETVVSPESANTFASFQSFMNNYGRCLDDRFESSTMMYTRADNTMASIRMSKLPKIIKLLLFHAYKWF